MEEPTEWEILRSLQRDMQRLIESQAQWVTKEVLDLRMAALEKDQQEDRTRIDRLTHGAWTVVLAPIIVGVVLYFLLGGKS